MPRRVVTPTEAQQILAAHREWLDSLGSRGTRADLTRAVLTDAVLRDAVLTRAVLTRAVLTRADLTRADLTRADLTRADLTRADLTDAVLTDADLTDADLTGADLTRADLTGADIPVVPRIDSAILAAIGPDGCKLDMANWHCGTSHCRAGWAITSAGEAGAKLEAAVGAATAGALIYAVSRPHKRIPNFYATNEEALASIKADAAEEQAR